MAAAIGRFFDMAAPPGGRLILGWFSLTRHWELGGSDLAPHPQLQVSSTFPNFSPPVAIRHPTPFQALPAIFKRLCAFARTARKVSIRSGLVRNASISASVEASRSLFMTLAVRAQI